MKQLFVFMISAILALSMDGQAFAASYHEDDKAALRAFLSQPSAESGQTNGERVGLSTADMATWESDETWVENIEGLTWNNEEPKRITRIGWFEKGLAGNLSETSRFYRHCRCFHYRSESQPEKESLTQ